MSEHLRVLGAAHGDVPDPRQRLHAALHVLRRDHRTSPPTLDAEEPERVAKAVAAVGLEYAVVTGVARDDIREDGGASHLGRDDPRDPRAQPRVRRRGARRPTSAATRDAIRTVVDAEPDVFAHNLETVRRIHGAVRKGFDYDRSLEVLRIAKQVRPEQSTKSGLILGMGETDDEVRESLQDLRDADVDLLTLGQYLSPSRAHPVVDRYVPPDVFDELGEYARSLGFAT